MKGLLLVLLMVSIGYTQNTTYKDGTECYCDSIVVDQSEYTYFETAYLNGLIVRDIRWLNNIIRYDTQYWILDDSTTMLMNKYSYSDGTDTLWYKNGKLHRVSINILFKQTQKSLYGCKEYKINIYIIMRMDKLNHKEAIYQISAFKLIHGIMKMENWQVQQVIRMVN